MHTLTFTSNSEPSIATKDTRELRIIFDRTRGLFKDKMEEHKQSHCSSDDILWMHKFIRHWLYTCMANTRGNFQTFLFIELLQVKIASESIKVCFLYREKPAPMNARAYEGETSTRDRRNPCTRTWNGRNLLRTTGQVLHMGRTTWLLCDRTWCVVNRLHRCTCSTYITCIYQAPTLGPWQKLTRNWKLCGKKKNFVYLRVAYTPTEGSDLSIKLTTCMGVEFWVIR